jgi:diguanylate cyclase (GGDEF)-like protein/PAS domain S-box-containing protein
MMNNVPLRDNDPDNNQIVRHILVVEDPEIKRTVTLDSATYSIGRHASNSIILSSQKISRHHATLLRRTDVRTNSYSYWILDGDLDGNRSRNGIFINGKKCLVHELKHGDIIEFGAEVKARYHIVADYSEKFENLDDDSDILQKQKPEARFADPNETVINERFADPNETVINERFADRNETLINERFADRNETIINERFADRNETIINERFADRNETIINEPDKPLQETVVVPYEVLARDRDAESNRLSSFAELNPSPIIEIDLEGKITYLNSAALVSFPQIDRLGLEHPLLAGLLDRRHNDNGNLFVREIAIDDKVFQQNVHYLPESQVVRSYLVDITEQKRLEVKLKQLQALHSCLLAQIKEGVAIIEPLDRGILEANDVYCELLGYSRREIKQLTLDEITFDREILAREWQRLSKSNSSSHRELSYRRKDNSLLEVDVSFNLVSVDANEVILMIVRDLTQQKNVEEQLRHQSFHDQLTGLPNQTMFKQQVATALANAKRNQGMAGVMFLELDYYKNIVTHLGNTLENNLLENCAERLKSSLRSGDTIGYWGGDKFAALMPQISSFDEVAKISQRILDVVTQPFKLGEHQLNIRVNIGIAIYPEDGLELETLIENAELALDRTKEAQRNSYQFHSLSMHNRASEQMELENALYHALEKNELTLYYQPQVNIESGDVKGVEALLRWHHPELGVLLPLEFINLAEQTGLIVPIGEWVLQTACAQNKIWQAKGLPPVKMSVNLSPLQFQQPNLAATIERILKETELEASLLELEVKMEILMQNVDFAREIIQDLKQIGVNIAVDDFGSGFSAFSYNSLKALSLSTLKIDQSFVQQLTDDSQDLAIVSAVVTIGHGFNLRIVAEGVETQQQFELLRNLHCEEMQGNWFSQPLPAEEATKFLPATRG